MSILLFLAGIASGVIGGMGMGGGTALIPMLTVFFGMGQHEAQALNLVSFIPMAACSLVIHAKCGRIKTRGVWLIILPAAVLSFSSSLLASAINGEVLKRIFGGFLIILSAFQFVLVVFSKKKREK